MLSSRPRRQTSAKRQLQSSPSTLGISHREEKELRRALLLSLKTCSYQPSNGSQSSDCSSVASSQNSSVVKTPLIGGRGAGNRPTNGIDDSVEMLSCLSSSSQSICGAKSARLCVSSFPNSQRKSRRSAQRRKPGEHILHSTAVVSSESSQWTSSSSSDEESPHVGSKALSLTSSSSSSSSSSLSPRELRNRATRLRRPSSTDFLSREEERQLNSALLQSMREHRRLTATTTTTNSSTVNQISALRHSQSASCAASRADSCSLDSSAANITAPSVLTSCAAQQQQQSSGRRSRLGVVGSAVDRTLETVPVLESCADLNEAVRLAGAKNRIPLLRTHDFVDFLSSYNLR